MSYQCIFGECGLKYPLMRRQTPRNFSYYPVKIGDYVTIGSGSIVEAAQIGNMVEIGRNCVIVGDV